MVIDDYLKHCGIDIKPSHEVDNLAGVMSLISSTRGVALLPTYARNLLPWPVTSRPLQGDQPTIDLCVGYNKANLSPILKVFLSRLDELVARTQTKRIRIRLATYPNRPIHVEISSGPALRIRGPIDIYAQMSCFLMTGVCSA